MDINEGMSAQSPYRPMVSVRSKSECGRILAIAISLTRELALANGFFPPVEVEVTLTSVMVTPLNTPSPRTRTFTLNPDKPFMLIGRASKTASKGLFAEDDNCWFDSPVMSRDHAKITIDENKSQFLMLQDCKSTHGTCIDDVRVDPGQEYSLKSGNTITFGQKVQNGASTFNAMKFCVNYSWQPWRPETIDTHASRKDPLVQTIDLTESVSERAGPADESLPSQSKENHVRRESDDVSSGKISIVDSWMERQTEEDQDPTTNTVRDCDVRSTTLMQAFVASDDSSDDEEPEALPISRTDKGLGGSKLPIDLTEPEEARRYAFVPASLASDVSIAESESEDEYEPQEPRNAWASTLKMINFDDEDGSDDFSDIRDVYSPKESSPSVSDNMSSSEDSIFGETPSEGMLDETILTSSPAKSEAQQVSSQTLRQSSFEPSSANAAHGQYQAHEGTKNDRELTQNDGLRSGIQSTMKDVERASLNLKSVWNQTQKAFARPPSPSDAAMARTSYSGLYNRTTHFPETHRVFHQPKVDLEQPSSSKCNLFNNYSTLSGQYYWPDTSRLDCGPSSTTHSYIYSNPRNDHYMGADQSAEVDVNWPSSSYDPNPHYISHAPWISQCASGVNEDIDQSASLPAQSRTEGPFILRSNDETKLASLKISTIVNDTPQTPVTTSCSTKKRKAEEISQDVTDGPLPKISTPTYGNWKPDSDKEAILDQADPVVPTITQEESAAVEERPLSVTHTEVVIPDVKQDQLPPAKRVKVSAQPSEKPRFLRTFLTGALVGGLSVFGGLLAIATTVPDNIYEMAKQRDG
ncbi:hypothetical protein MMC25_001358 [Agyrium rufum]|nr:hypothetical protein [Agyrium rufum]